MIRRLALTALILTPAGAATAHEHAGMTGFYVLAGLLVIGHLIAHGTRSHA